MYRRCIPGDLHIRESRRRLLRCRPVQYASGVTAAAPKGDILSEFPLQYSGIHLVSRRLHRVDHIVSRIDQIPHDLVDGTAGMKETLPMAGTHRGEFPVLPQTHRPLQPEFPDHTPEPAGVRPSPSPPPYVLSAKFPEKIRSASLFSLMTQCIPAPNFSY